MKTRHFLIMLLFTSFCYAQNQNDNLIVSKKTRKIVKEIEQINRLEGRAVGASGSKPKQYENFEKLKKNASVEELEFLTNHENGVIRCYAFWGLSETNFPKLIDTGLKHLNDTAFVSTIFGCLGNGREVGDFILSELYFNLERNNEYSKIKFLDSTLLYTNCLIEFKDIIISKVTNEDVELYPRIRELAITGNNQAIISLAKFQRKKDISLIKNHYSKSELTTIRAIEFFPNDEFKVLLNNYSEKALKQKGGFKSEWRYFYNAIAKYKDDWAANILSKPLVKVKNKKIQKYYVDYVFEGIAQNLCPQFEDLLYQCWLNWNKSNTKTLEYLLSKKKNVGKELIFTTLENVEKYSGGGSHFSQDKEDIPFTEFVLSKALELDRDKAIDTAVDKIKKTNVHEIKYFSKLIPLTQNEKLIQAAFVRLEKEWNAHIYLNLLEHLLALKNNEINMRIKKVTKSNHEMSKKWGGDEVEKLLNEYAIK